MGFTKRNKGRGRNRKRRRLGVLNPSFLEGSCGHGCFVTSCSCARGFFLSNISKWAANNGVVARSAAIFCQFYFYELRRLAVDSMSRLPLTHRSVWSTTEAVAACLTALTLRLLSVFAKNLQLLRCQIELMSFQQDDKRLEHIIRHNVAKSREPNHHSSIICKEEQDKVVLLYYYSSLLSQLCKFPLLFWNMHMHLTYNMRKKLINLKYHEKYSRHSY